MSALIGAPSASAAGAGQYSAPEWWPLRGQNLIGCSRNSPGPICTGNYHPIWAIDVQAAEGQPIYASGAGLASVKSNSTGCSGYGKSVVVNHNGSFSLYAHMSNFAPALSASPGGVWVDENSVIGYVGHTGAVSNCSYNHLHYEESTSGSWWAGATDPGSFKACHGAGQVAYPQAWGASSWSGLAAHSLTARHDGPTCSGGIAWPPANGIFISHAGFIYRIAGGAPLYISSWDDVGGPQAALAATDAQFYSLNLYPSDGTFVAAGGYVYRFAGGAPLYISSWDDVGGPQSSVGVSLSTLNYGDGPVPFNHVRAHPADGSFVAAGGYVFRFAGGAPLYISSWDDVGGPQSSVGVSLSTLNYGNGPAPFNHVRAFPRDGAFVAAGGYVFRFAGGAPLYISSWDDVGGPQSSVEVSLSTLNYGDGPVPYNHMRAHPADATFVAAGGYVFRFAGGAPLYVSNWENVGGPQASVEVSLSTLNYGDGPVPFNHVHPFPKDGTILTGMPGGASYRVFQGAAVPLPTHSAGVEVDQAVINNAGGPVPWSHLLKAGSGFHPMVPARVLDSRNTTGGWNARLVAGAPKSLKVTGGNIPISTSAVVMNVTATDASDGSFLTVYPAGTSVPNASNINFGAGETIPNLVTVKVGTSGQVSFANAVGSVDVVADIVGWYDDGLAPGDMFQGVAPTRLLDSRTTTGNWNANLDAGPTNTRDLQIVGAVVPASATAVTLNVTATDSDAGSFVQTWPTGSARPNSSNLNFGPRQTIANMVTVQIGSGGKVSFYNAVGSVDLVVDVVGYYDPAEGGGRLHSLTPSRLLDDRIGTGLTGPWSPGQTRALTIAGTSAVPATAKAVVLNATVTNGTAGSFITVFADLTPRPNASNVNFGPGQTIANLAITNIGTNGKVAIYNTLGTVDVIADVVGYYAPS